MAGEMTNPERKLSATLKEQMWATLTCALPLSLPLYLHRLISSAVIHQNPQLNILTLRFLGYVRSYQIMQQ